MQAVRNAKFLDGLFFCDIINCTKGIKMVGFLCEEVMVMTTTEKILLTLEIVQTVIAIVNLLN